MRDILVMGIVMVGVLAALRRPWIGVMLWTWVSMMNPHRFTYGFAYGMPVAAIAAGVTLLSLLMTKDRDSPLKGAPTAWLALFVVWITLSWLAGWDPEGDYEQWKKVMKIFLMVFVTLSLLRTKQHIMAFAWIVVVSLGLIGIKGGIFTISTGGGYRVWGPPDTFIEENNAFAVAVIMTIPLMRFLQMQMETHRVRLLMTAAMVLMAASALGSQSRGALLALSAMSVVMWWRMKSNRLTAAVVFGVVGVLLIGFMPDQWTQRMSTIDDYQQDASALGRISAWWVAWGIAKNYVLGVGMNAARPELFAAYSPYETQAFVAHSIYFQMLGQHGFIGLALFLGIFVATFWMAGRLRKQGALSQHTHWCSDLGAMTQVSLVGYAAGGAFLDLAYFDLPYNVMVMVALATVWVRTRAWEREQLPTGRWWRLIGLRPASASPAPAPAPAARVGAI